MQCSVSARFLSAVNKLRTNNRCNITESAFG